MAFEGQAAMELEMILDNTESGSYDFFWEDDDPRRIASAPIIRGVVRDVEAGHFAEYDQRPVSQHPDPAF